MSDAKSCGSVNQTPELAYGVVGISAVLAIGTVVLHAFIIHSIAKDHKKKFQHFFYKLILNISIADILVGAVTDPYSVAFHIVEGMKKKQLEIKAIHLMLFILGSVPLATMIVLCVDRVLVLLRPLSYRKGLQGSKSWMVVVATWIVSIVQTSAYFKVGYITYLLVFASINVAGASIAMILTSVIYHKNIGNIVKRPTESQEENTLSTLRRRPSDLRRVRERNATKTFIIMSVVTIISYLPNYVAIGYMDLCRDCNCVIVHLVRDLAFVSLLGGPLFRAINFLICLKPLRPHFRVKDNYDNRMSDFSSTDKK